MKAAVCVFTCKGQGRNALSVDKAADVKIKRVLGANLAVEHVNIYTGA